MDTFTAGSCIRFGWETFKKRPWFFIGVEALVILLSVIARYIPILGFFVIYLISMGGIAFMLKAHDDVQTLELKDYWRLHPFWKFVGGNLLSGLIVIGGMILFIIPGIIWAVMFSFVSYLIIDKNLGPIEAIKESARITKGYRWALFRLGILAGLIILLGVVCLVVGTLVAVPVASLAVAHAYRVLGNRVSETVSASVA
jgi:uncharacterized membrane protein